MRRIVKPPDWLVSLLIAITLLIIAAIYLFRNTAHGEGSKGYRPLIAFLALSACVQTDRSYMAANGDFDILESLPPGTDAYDYRISVRTMTYPSYTHRVAHGLELPLELPPGSVARGGSKTRRGSTELGP